ncbi:MAG: tRNA (guanosine(46)-N7)-methyltransferase TrmB [Alphaproteobacteria bacterium]|nr:tRNA (guanosine(46)-N7)-methyltransferase TrmB [Alphaproteobacteria bacterium]
MEKQEIKHFETQELRTFGRRHGKKLSTRKTWLMENLLPKISPIYSEISQNSAILEIGFGNGEHLRDLAIHNQNMIIVGAEPFANGVAALLSAITNESDNLVKPEYKNIRIYPDDVRLLLHSKDFENAAFLEIWVLHPDPWPKARHEKRRLLNHDFLNLLSEHLTDDGKIIIGTDHWEYYDWIVEQLNQTNLEIKSTKLDIIKTRYQIKNKAGTTEPKYLILSNKIS